MFMQSDPLWSLAMALNVYLVFFHRYDAASLKRLFWIYGLVCYGVPFIPAMICLLLRNKKKGEIYGNATLWCWIDNEWAPLRIYSYYAPVWAAIFFSFIIYIRVGIEIWEKRRQLRTLDQSSGGTVTSFTAHTSPEPFTGIRTTEVKVTHDKWNNKNIDSPERAFSRLEKNLAEDHYSITISSVRDSKHGLPTPRAGVFTKGSSTSIDRVKWAYTKCALLFAVSILITWVPASVNRVYGLIYPTKPSFALNVGSALVLPLQGFWNTVIYFTTSLSTCRVVWARTSTNITGKLKGLRPK
jgi:hypothetical protein